MSNPHINHAVVNGKPVTYGAPPSYEKIKKIINKEVQKLSS